MHIHARPQFSDRFAPEFIDSAVRPCPSHRLLLASISLPPCNNVRKRKPSDTSKYRGNGEIIKKDRKCVPNSPKLTLKFVPGDGDICHFELGASLVPHSQRPICPRLENTRLSRRSVTDGPMAAKRPIAVLIIFQIHYRIRWQLLDVNIIRTTYMDIFQPKLPVWVTIGWPLRL